MDQSAVINFKSLAKAKIGAAGLSVNRGFMPAPERRRTI
jgi:hypothetical protein